MTPEAAAGGVSSPLLLRRPAWAWGLGGLAVVHAIGLLIATASAMALLGLGWGVAEGLNAPAVMATVLTAVELGPRLRRAQLDTIRRCVVGAARAWGAVGAAWPFVWAVAAYLDGNPGDLAFEALRVLAGGAIGAAAGAAGGFCAARLVLHRL